MNKRASPIAVMALTAATLLLGGEAASHGQAPEAPIYAEGRGARGNAALLMKAQKLTEEKLLPMTMAAAAAQMKERTGPCKLELPAVKTNRLEGREVWKAARAAHLRVGWRYLCTKCDRWHLNLAGGYAITADGAVVTCAHVVQPGEDMKEGQLVAVTDADEVLPVTEILAFSQALDTAVLRVKSAAPLSPLPLALTALPGDRVWCFSDPEGKRGYFSDGIVSRFVKRPFLRRKEAAAAGKLTGSGGGGGVLPTWVETTTDWAPGSSGSAIVDEFGNAVGHVSEIQTMLEPTDEEEEDMPARKKGRPQALGTTIVFHQGISAQTVLTMVKKP